MSLLWPFGMSHPLLITLLFLVAALDVFPSESCHSESTQMHACLHTFLERDFPQIQAYLDQQSQDVRGRRKMLLEGPTLSSICTVLQELDNCYEAVAEGCTQFFYMIDFDRLITSFRSWQNLFCSGPKDGLKAFLQHGACVERFRKRVGECDIPELQWPLVWAQIFRLQKNSAAVCGILQEHSQCMLEWLPRSECGQDASDMYNRTMTTWLDSWCNGCRTLTTDLVVCLSAALALWFAR